MQLILMSTAWCVHVATIKLMVWRCCGFEPYSTSIDISMPQWCLCGRCTAAWNLRSKFFSAYTSHPSSSVWSEHSAIARYDIWIFIIMIDCARARAMRFHSAGLASFPGRSMGVVVAWERGKQRVDAPLHHVHTISDYVFFSWRYKLALVEVCLWLYSDYYGRRGKLSWIPFELITTDMDNVFIGYFIHDTNMKWAVCFIWLYTTGDKLCTLLDHAKSWGDSGNSSFCPGVSASKDTAYEGV